MVIKIGDMENIVNPKDEDLQIINKENKTFAYNEVERLEEVNNVKDVLITLDKDEVGDDNLTTIDFNTRLGETEIAPIVALQMLHSLQVGGSACSLITRSIKRHKVSLGGKGRQEKVDIIKGDREQEANVGGGNLFGKIKGFMGGQKNE